jgi:hypothetical protein
MILHESSCPICKKQDIEKLAELSPEDRFAGLTHNAWTQQTQIKIFRKALLEGEDIRNLIFSMASSPLIKKFLQILDRFLVKKEYLKSNSVIREKFFPMFVDITLLRRATINFELSD